MKIVWTLNLTENFSFVWQSIISNVSEWEKVIDLGQQQQHFILYFCQ